MTYIAVLATSGLHSTDVHNPLFPANQDMFLE